MAVAEGDTVWMDPTCNLCAFGDIPRSDEGIYGLAVTDSGGVLVRVPSSAPQQNVVHRETKLRILPDRTVMIDLLYTATGNPAQYIRSRLREADRQVRDRFAKLLCGGDLNSCSLVSVDFRELENTEQPVELWIEARTVKPISSFNNVLHLKTSLRPVNCRYDTLDYEGRLVPVYLGYPDSNREDVIITWYPGLRIDSVHMPAAATVSCGYTDWNLTSSVSGDTARISIMETTSSELVPVDGLIPFRFHK